MSNTSGGRLGFLSLRSKAVATGVVIVFLISGVTTSFTLFTVRAYITNQRITSATNQAAVLSREVARLLRDGIEPNSALEEISASSNSIQTFLETINFSITARAGTDISTIPEMLRANAHNGTPGRQIYKHAGTPYLAMAFPIEIENSSKYVFISVVSLSELNRIIVILGRMLVIGVMIASILGGIVGLWLSRRVSEPLRRVGDAALLIAAGDLAIQLPHAKEPDLNKISTSFNEMTKSLRNRIDREARFGAVVSHELRSPLTAIRSASDLLDSHRAELSPQLASTVDLLSERVVTFQKILNDLIEISRYESGNVQPNLEELKIIRILESLLARHHMAKDDFLEATSSEDQTVLVDAKRFKYIFDNLIDNATLYAGGIAKIRVETIDDNVYVHFDDAGIGIPPTMQKLIFDPFVRGARHSNIHGSGLGLAIAKEHATNFLGSISVSTSPEGGARFTVGLQKGSEAE